MGSVHVTVIDVNLDNLVYNYNVVRRYVGRAEVIPVLKGNGYGHGAVALARTLVEVGCRRIAVAKLSEALELRLAGIAPQKADILIMGAMLPEEMEAAVELDCSMFIPDLLRLEYLDKIAGERSYVARFHLKVDTGMGRAGFLPEEVSEVSQALKRLRHCRLEGIATHLAAPGEDTELNAMQLRRFEEFVAALDPPKGCLVHMASSTAAVRFPHMIKDAVRVGDLIYGLCSVEPPFELRPLLTYRTRITQVKRLPAGWHVGYGTDRWVREPIIVATVPMGTTDGVLSSQAGRASFLVNGRRCTLLAACADTCMLDVSAAEPVNVGDEAVFIGRQGGEVLTAREQAVAAGTGFSELLAKVSLRIPRVYWRSGRQVGEMSSLGSVGIAACESCG